MATNWKAQRINVTNGHRIGDEIEFVTPGDDEKVAADGAARRLVPHASGAASDGSGQWRVLVSGRMYDQIDLRKVAIAKKTARNKGPKFTLTRIPLDRQGYTKGKYPRYYGAGPDIWQVENEEGEQMGEFRAKDRTTAKGIWLKQVPDARF